jgi:hypothetical protein
MVNPHFARTRIDAALCLATYVNNGRVVTSSKNCRSAAIATPLPQNSLPIHLVRLPLALVLEEDRQVVLGHLTQGDVPDLAHVGSIAVERGSKEDAPWRW